MRIIIAVTSSLSYRLIEGQINFLTSNGYEVHFCSSYCETTKRQVELEGGVFHPVNLEREISFLKDIKSIIKVVKLIKTIKPDIINCSTPKAGLIYCISSLFYGQVKTIFTLRGLRSDTLRGLKYRIVKFTEYLSCKIADKVIVVSPSLKNHSIAKGILIKEKAIVIGEGSSNGINLKRFTRTSEIEIAAQKIRKENGLNDSNVVIGYVGRLVSDKGIKELYHAFCYLRKSYSNIRLLLIGSFESGDELDKDLIHEMKTNPDVIILNYMENIEIAFPAMDCFVLYSYREGFGNVSIEAAAMELPVVVADIPGLKDTIIHNKTGLLAKARDENELYNVLLKMVGNANFRKLLGENGRDRVVKYFQREFIWTEQLEIYKKIIEK